MRFAQEGLGEAHAQPRAPEKPLPAILHAERGQPEVAGMAAGIRPTAAKRLACQARQPLLQGWSERKFLPAQPQRHLVGEGALRAQAQGQHKVPHLSWSSNFFSTRARSSAEAFTTGGNSPSISNGRQASITAREFQVTPRGRRGSSGPLQWRRMKSISSAGSQRVHIAQITSSRFVGSTSSSTTTTKRPRYEPDWQLAASSAACLACPANACLIAITLNMRAQPASCTQTPFTPPRPARSTSSQIMPAFITHLEYEKSDGGTMGQASPRIGSLR